MPPKVGSIQAIVSISVRIIFGELDIEYVDPGELLEQARLAFHDRLAASGPIFPRPSTAVPLVTTATGLLRAVNSSACNGSAICGAPPRVNTPATDRVALPWPWSAPRKSPRPRQTMMFEAASTQILIHRVPRFYAWFEADAPSPVFEPWQRFRRGCIAAIRSPNAAQYFDCLLLGLGRGSASWHVGERFSILAGRFP
jgi:hypothetical protein